MMNQTADAEKKSFLKKITISGYKSFGTGSLGQSIPLSDINIVIGANGSGKSSFVSFFKMLNNIMTGAFQLYVGKNGTSENLLHFGSKQTQLIHASLEFKNATDSDVYDFSLVKAVNDTLIYSEESISWNGRRKPLASGQSESCLVSSSATEPSETVVRRILANCRAYQFHDTSDTAHIRNAARVDDNRSLKSDGGNVAAVLYMLKTKSPEYRRYYDRIVDKVRFVVPQFDDFELEPLLLNENYIKLNWKEKGEGDYVFGPEQLSDGSIRFIALATLFLLPPNLLPNVIVIDEPELGLHPQAVDALAAMMKTASHHAQIIAATQSDRLLDSFEPENIIVAEHDAQNHCSVFKHLDAKELEIWLADYSLSQLWEKNVLGGQP
jgi:predicted ATPase